jgi:hypothetical protein
MYFDILNRLLEKEDIDFKTTLVIGVPRNFKFGELITNT